VYLLFVDSEEEARPRLKPVFVRKAERITIKDKEDEEEALEKAEEEAKKKASERREETLKLVENSIRKDKKGAGAEAEDVEKEANLPQITDVATDDENEELEYEGWKLRELQRIKRDRDEREA
jgi:microfibrillar-associated protein 1